MTACDPAHSDDFATDRTGYRHVVPVARQVPKPVPPATRLPALDGFLGKWVAVKNDRVVAAADSSRELAYELHKLGGRAAGAVMRYVAEPSSAVMVGLG